MINAIKKCKKCKLYFSDNININEAYKSVNNKYKFIKWNNSIKSLITSNLLTLDDEYLLNSNPGFIEDYIIEYDKVEDIEFKKIEILSITNNNNNNVIKFEDIDMEYLKNQIINTDKITINNITFEFKTDNLPGIISQNTTIIFNSNIILNTISKNTYDIDNVIIILSIKSYSSLLIPTYVNIKNFNISLNKYLDNNLVNCYHPFIINVDNIDIIINIKDMEHKMVNIKSPTIYYNIRKSKMVIDEILSDKILFYVNEYSINNVDTLICFKLESSNKNIIIYDEIYNILKRKIQDIKEFYTDSIINVHHIKLISNEYFSLSFKLETIKINNINIENRQINKFKIDNLEHKTTLLCDIKIIKYNATKELYLIDDDIKHELKSIKISIKKIQIKTLSELKILDIRSKLFDILINKCLIIGLTFNDSDYIYTVIDYEYTVNTENTKKIDYIYLTNITDKTIFEIEPFNNTIITNKESCINLNIENIKNFHKHIAENHMGGMKPHIDKIIREVLISRTNILDKSISKYMKKSNGIIIHGPPGTGKTTFAKNIGQIIGCIPSNITMITSTEILNKYLGESEQNIRNIFNNARSDYSIYGDNSPLHLIIIDEIDAILGSRSNNDSVNIKDSIVNQFLGILDGLNTINNFIIIGITNLLSKIDKAILRPGRFGCHIYIGLPDIEQRKEIIKINIKKFNMDDIIFERLDTKHIASITDNFSGADIENIFIQAINKYILQKLDNILNNKKITQNDINEIISNKMYTDKHY